MAKAAKKTAKKTTAKKTTAKKTVKKKTVKKKTVGKKTEAKEHGVKRIKDLPWCDKKKRVFKALKSLKALTVTSAVSAKTVSKKAGISTRDVRHYCYHAAAANLIAVSELENVRGYAFSLTKVGANVDINKVDD